MAPHGTIAMVVLVLALATAGTAISHLLEAGPTAEENATHPRAPLLFSRPATAIWEGLLSVDKAKATELVHQSCADVHSWLQACIIKGAATAAVSHSHRVTTRLLPPSIRGPQPDALSEPENHAGQGQKRAPASHTRGHRGGSMGLRGARYTLMRPAWCRPSRSWRGAVEF